MIKRINSSAVSSQHHCKSRLSITMSLNKKISQESASSVSSEFDLFSTPPTQNQIAEGWFETLEAADYSQQSNQVKFLVTEDDRHCIDLSESTVEVQLKVTKADGTNLAGAANNVAVYPEDNFGHSLFRKVSLQVNSQTMEYHDNYAEKAYIENLVNTTKAVKETTLAIEGWKEDGARGKNGDETEDDDATSRKSSLLGSRTMTYVIHPKLAMFQQDKVIPPGTALTLIFEKSNPKFALRSGVANPANGAKVIITKATLHLRKVRLIDEAFRPLMKTWTGYIGRSGKMVPGTPTRYTHKKALVQRHTVTTGVTNYTIPISAIRRPSRVFIALTDDVSVGGHYVKSAFSFDHFNIRKILLKVDGKPVDDELTPNFEANGDVTKAYYKFIQACGRQHFGSSSGLTLEDFKAGTTIFGWDLSRGLKNQLEVVQDIQLRIELMFGVALPHTISVLAYLESDEHIELGYGQSPVVI